MNALLILLAISQLVLGGLVQAQPGLVCVDWPLCYGSFAPVDGTSALYEWGHRLVAGLLLVGSALLAFQERRRGRESWMPLFWVIAQALLGWITFSYRLPTLVTVTHLLMVPLYIFSLLNLSVTEESQSTTRHARDLPLLFIILTFFIMFLGGLIRKTGVGLVNEPTPLATIRLLHRALGVSTLVALLTSWFWLRPRVSMNSRRFFLPWLLAFVQLLAGIALWRSDGMGAWRLLHLTLGGMLITSLLVVWLQIKSSEPGWLGDFLLLTKARLGTLVMATVLVGMLLAPFQLTFLASLTVFLGIAMQAMGACALNCVLEKDIDALMERTRIRPLPGGRMTILTANVIGWSLVVVGTALILVVSNGLTAFLGVFTVLIYLYAYTPLKTRSPWALVVGAIPGATPPLMGWTAVTGEVSGVGWYLFLFLFFWQLPHFLAIAVYHQKDYANAHILTFFQQKNATFIKRWVLVLSLILGGLSFFPYDGERSSAAYHFVSLVFGGAFFGLALQGWLMREEGDEFRKWARTYFIGTLFYLPLQLAAMLMLP